MNGFVYVQTNDAEHNEVVVFGRSENGSLARLSGYLTGGEGSGAPHLPSQSSVLLSGERLYVTNAGSDDVTVFDVRDAELQVRDRVASGGSAPRSVAVHGDRVFVLNTGAAPSIAPLGGAAISLPEGSDPAQIAFTPDGRTLLVTDRASNSIHAFSVSEDGNVGARVTHASSGATPYGFAVTARGVLVVTEAAGAQVGKASASSYRLEGAAELAPVSGAVGNTRSEVCWAVTSKDGRLAFVTNFGDGTISTYGIADDGSLELRAAVAATTVDGQPGVRDEALSADGQYLYALHADTGRVFGWKVDADGALAEVGSANGLPLTAAGLAAS